MTQAQSSTIAKIGKSFDALVGPENTGLYIGPQFKDEQGDAWDGSHIYLETSNYIEGTVIYKDQSYFDVPLRYDLFEDQLSIQSPDYLPIFRIKLIPEHVSSFSLHGRQFINLKDQTITQGNGFFEVAFIGNNLSCYIKHRKTKKRETVDKVLQYRLETHNHYLLQLRKEFYTIYSLRDLKAVFPDKYNDIRNFRRQNKSLAKKQPDEFMIKLTTHLDKELNDQ